MAYNHQRLSTMSSLSSSVPRPPNGQSTQVSVQTLLNALHTSYSNGLPHPLEASTSLVVNTWQTAQAVGVDGRYGGTTDQELARKAWEHARRRAEDACIILGSLHDSTPAMMAPMVSCLPIQAPSSFYAALEVVRALTHCSTAKNPSFPRYSALSAKFDVTIGEGEIVSASLALSKSGLDTERGLLNIPSEAGTRAFDALYYLITSSSSPKEKERLDLKPYSAYHLLKRSGTFLPPSYIPTADDAAAAEDFRNNLKSIGIKGRALVNFICCLAGLLKLGDVSDYFLSAEEIDSICDAVSLLLDVPKAVIDKQSQESTVDVFISGVYEALVDWVIARANAAMQYEIRTGKTIGSDNGMDTPPAPAAEEDETVSIRVINIPDQDLGKAVALRTVFDDSEGINAEMKEDGVEVVPPGVSVIREMQTAVQKVEPDLGIMTNAAGHERERQLDRREGVLEAVAQSITDLDDCFLTEILHPVSGQGVVLGNHGRFDLANVISSSRVWFQLSLHPTDEDPAKLADLTRNHWSAGAVSSQLRAWRLPEWANRRNRALDYTADFALEEFVDRYAPLGCQEGREGIEMWLMERGWSNGEVVVGKERVWLRETAWWEAETMLEMQMQNSNMRSQSAMGGVAPAQPPMGGNYSVHSPALGSSLFGANADDASNENLLSRNQSFAAANKSRLTMASKAGTLPANTGGDYGLGTKGDSYKGEIRYENELESGRHVTEVPQSKSRKAWVALVWALTFWIPSPLLHLVGRMKRPDVRLAWREKVVLMFLIFLLNGLIVFYIIEFGRLLCPNFDKAWLSKEVAYHQGESDYWVSHAGFVYDLTKFWRLQHSDTNIETTSALMLPFAGTDVTELIRPPLTKACPGYVTDTSLYLQANNTVQLSQAIHYQGPLQTTRTSKLASLDWYQDTFLPKMREYYKGDLVWSIKDVQSQGQNDQRMWFRLGNDIYDLTDYFYNRNTVHKDDPRYQFFPSVVEQAVQSNPGGDLTSAFDAFNTSTRETTLNCLNNYFYFGRTDFRTTPRCQVNNYLLLAFTIILCTVIAVKFLSALQLEPKRRPAPQDKFVICQVPAYTEGEEQLRKGLDSLTSLAYDNKRKLICVMCDGMVVGGGNDRPTPKIVLDILGVDPKIDPPALPFKSVGEGAEQLNYGKVYSGLYEYEGNVVPYIVIVKVGKDSEQGKPKPGNRGKRDSQVMLMSFLNRVHHRAPMSPLELEMYHQISNVIGVDPELYEYLLMVDADTMVTEDSLNRLVAACANDSKIAGICGETSLDNEDRSWWTMIQVYEYYISHHLAKAFESLFGSVTCLPGCFCMYRLRTADKGKPLIISDKVINDYSDGHVDTLHKKNLLALGEDRYLTTLMIKYFPSMSYKFVPSARALTAAPETWSILLSQRRRWINSTIHNLAELMFVHDMCGFCCFSMRFVVFIDLFGTLILPATCAYLGYLIYKVATHSGQFPIVSIAMLAAVYGLQALIFLIKRQWQHIGWMIIYILAFPIYSLALPIYSFWKQDDFSWGNTRVVQHEDGSKKVVLEPEAPFDPKSIPLQRWDDYAAANGLPCRRGLQYEKEANAYDYEVDDVQSQYSYARPASTVLTGMNHGHMPPQSPGPYQTMQGRQSTYSNLTGYQMNNMSQDRHMSMANMSDAGMMNSGHQNNRPSMMFSPPVGSTDNLMTPNSHNSFAGSSPNLLGGASRARSPLGFGGPNNRASAMSRPMSTVNFMDGPSRGPTDQEIQGAVAQILREVDLDSMSKKQLKALVEQRLQTQLQGERKNFLDKCIDDELSSMDV
ncbi:uncharacterized protein PV09_00930 [Verruconis gallopava]|uniref:chitin synthase n=1 Tax=Verruconis gallopava TaxID=253628 RepID=A0A0D1Z7X7_9PEZI|nr:uncharacterized protein PV09_00930 [Verruconis gallopava]KIW09037.1 hypothetical protein PV09_00930 [Verruconis gallopava]